MQKDTEIIPPPLPDLDLCPIADGEFIMGDDSSKYDDEKPAHAVHVAGFYMGKFQVTQRLWQEVMGSNPAKFKGERRPVETVSWKDAQDFLSKLNARADVQAFIRQLDPSGIKFRLPTEAEWEFAARGGIYSQGYTYAGSDRLKQVGWHDKNSDDKAHEIGQLLANELGLHDMSGNVYEWCQDWFSDSYYEECHKRGGVENPQGPDRGTSRVLRGGSWIAHPVYCRSVLRNRLDPGRRSGRIGCRLVLPFQAVGS
ncbi:Formylglycine-generating enzyme family protein [Candidatus Electrothrix laxa]